MSWIESEEGGLVMYIYDARDIDDKLKIEFIANDLTETLHRIDITQAYEIIDQLQKAFDIGVDKQPEPVKINPDYKGLTDEEASNIYKKYGIKE